MLNPTPRFPLTYKNIQYNHCKNPKCENFGLEPSQTAVRGGVPGTYQIVGGAKDFPLLKCNKCGEMPPMKSNLGIYEEVQRIGSYLRLYKASERASCTNEACSNHNTAHVTDKTAYSSFGTSTSGAKRFKCKACGKTFSVATKPTTGQHDTHQNIEIFKLLVNKVPLRRIVHLTGVSWAVLYNRIDFIHKQCLAFAAHREMKLRDMEIPKLYISVDKQDYMINWSNRKVKRNVVITAIASADNTTGYIFGINPNFDYTLDRDQIEADAQLVNDSSKKEPFRKYARLWLEADYAKSQNRSNRRRGVASLKDGIEQTYMELSSRDDVENFDTKATSEEQLPNYGIQIHSEYTMIAHFHLLKGLMPNVGKWRFFLDQESGIRSAVLSVFKEGVANHTAEAFYVRIEKDLTVDEKRKFKADAKKKFDKIKQYNQLLSDNDVKLEMLKEEIQNVTSHGKWNDRWVRHPFPSMTEANKAMCWLTEHYEFHNDKLVEEIDGEASDNVDGIVTEGVIRRVNKKVVSDHVAWLYNKASLHGIDVFFQKIRRRLSMLERPIHSASNSGRTWHGYSPYNPAMVVKMLEMYRVVHNYVDLPPEGKKAEKTTPAMRLGLAQAPLDYKDILYFNE